LPLPFEEKSRSEADPSTNELFRVGRKSKGGRKQVEQNWRKEIPPCWDE